MLTMAVVRREKKISQQTLADLIGVKQVDISWIERGQLKIDDEKRATLAERLNLDPDDLLIDYADYVLEHRGGGS